MTEQMIEVDGVSRPATDSRGRRIALTDEGLVSFWRFFGEADSSPTSQASPETKRGSGVVEESTGRPLVVYHGTNQDVGTFDESRIGENTTAACSIAFFFSESPHEASEYAELAGRTQLADAVNIERKVAALKVKLAQAERRGDWDTVEALTHEWEDLELGAVQAEPSGQNIMPVYLRLKNFDVLDMQGTFDGHVVAKAIETAKEAGKDGLKLINAYDPVVERPGGFVTTQWVVFRAENIKSALGNPGTFDPHSAHITDGHEVRIGEPVNARELADDANDEDRPTRRFRP